MSSFQQLLVNSTNRLSTRNIIISQPVFHNRSHDNKSINIKNMQTKHLNIIGLQNSQLNLQSMQDLNIKHIKLQNNIKEANNQKNIMMALFEKLIKIEQGQSDKLKKRFRRKKDEIQTKYNCPVSKCRKAYSSSTSLARHMKLKHASMQFQPPQPYYQVPPSPNLQQQGEDQGSQMQKRDETKSIIKELIEDNQNYQQVINNECSILMKSQSDEQEMNEMRQKQNQRQEKVQKGSQKGFEKDQDENAHQNNNEI